MAAPGRFERWVTQAVQHRLAVFWLAVISFAEASFFPIPPDVFLMPMVALQRKKWLQLGLLTALYSVLGGIAGYVIGLLFYEGLAAPLISFYGVGDEVANVGLAFQGQAFWTVFVSAFTPIPYKVFTIASGFFQIELFTFLAGALLGRGLRFMVEAWLMYRYGEQMARAAFRSFNTVVLLLVAIGTAVIMWIF